MNTRTGIVGVLNRLADILMLNMIYIISCIPIITIGAATTALYYITMKMAEGEKVEVWYEYKKTLKNNFKQAAIIWAVLLPIMLVVIANFLLLPAMEQRLGTIVGVTSVTVGIFLLIEMIFVFPLLAGFNNSVINTMKNAIMIFVRHLPLTIIITAIHLLPLALGLLSLYVFISGFMVVMIFLISTIAYVESIILVRIFKKYY